MRIVITCLSILLFAGCAASSRSSVIEPEKGVYLVVQQGDRFWEAESRLNAQVLAEAQEFCGYRDQNAEVIKIRPRTYTPRPGVEPETEIYFKCVGDSASQQR